MNSESFLYHSNLGEWLFKFHINKEMAVFGQGGYRSKIKTHCKSPFLIKLTICI